MTQKKLDSDNPSNNLLTETNLAGVQHPDREWKPFMENSMKTVELNNITTGNWIFPPETNFLMSKCVFHSPALSSRRLGDFELVAAEFESNPGGKLVQLSTR